MSKLQQRLAEKRRVDALVAPPLGPWSEKEFWLMCNLVLVGGITDRDFLHGWFNIPGKRGDRYNPHSIGQVLNQKYGRMRLADICGNCHVVFGYTLGGRVRHHCPCCKPVNITWDSTPFSKQFHQIVHFTGVWDSPIAYYLERVFPTRYYDGDYTEDKDYDTVTGFYYRDKRLGLRP